jgi:4a-hydroxytetrahydrobiopterin dehydratase
VRSRHALLASRCRQLASGALSDSEVAAQLSLLPDWKLASGAIARTFRFSNYHETIAFVNALAWVVHAEDHHPDLAVGYDRCEVRFSTHSVGGISDNDFICAAKADAVYAQRAASATA